MHGDPQAPGRQGPRAFIGPSFALAIVCLVALADRNEILGGFQDYLKALLIAEFLSVHFAAFIQDARPAGGGGEGAEMEEKIDELKLMGLLYALMAIIVSMIMKSPWPALMFVGTMTNRYPGVFSAAKPEPDGKSDFKIYWLVCISSFFVSMFPAALAGDRDFPAAWGMVHFTILGFVGIYWDDVRRRLRGI